MSITTARRGTTPPHTQPTTRTSPMRRTFGVVTHPQTFRNIAYLLFGLALGTIWFSVLISGLAVGVSMLVVALLGVPLLLALWYLTRWFANVERSTARVLLGQRLPRAPMAAPDRGNVWVRLRSMTADHDRWRELGYLLLRFPVGIATFTIAVTALATPILVAYTPFAARYGDDHPFGQWRLSSRMEQIASSSPWSWSLIPLGAALLIAAMHLVNAVARACGRWTTAWLGSAPGPGQR